MNKIDILIRADVQAFAEVALHKARFACLDVPTWLRMESLLWLEGRGYCAGFRE